MAEKLVGTKILDKIVPLTSADQYPTHDSIYGKGGWREVNTYEEMNAIPSDRRTNGMAVYVNSENKLYVLNNGHFVEFANSGGSGDKNFTAEVTSRTEWVIRHNMNKKPAIHCYDTEGREIYGDESYPDLDTVRVVFSAEVGGSIVLN